MRDPNTRVLIINRIPRPEEGEIKTLDELVQALKPLYAVTEQPDLWNLSRTYEFYDVIIAHPETGTGIIELYEQHEKHPHVPLVISSFVTGGNESSPFQGFTIDSDGVYHGKEATIQDYVAFINEQTAE